MSGVAVRVEPLGRGEEVRVDFGPATSKATFITPGNVEEVPLAGVAGYSLCADPGSGRCPFYLGSLSVSATESITVIDTCRDQSPFSAELIELQSAAVPTARPPEVEITTSTAVPCPGVLVLTHVSSDPDDDLASVRGVVDGMLLAPGISTIPLTQSHELVAIARDARGATTTDVRMVTCM